MTTTNGHRSTPGIPKSDLDRFEEIVANVLFQRSGFVNQFLDPRRNIDDECGYPPTTEWGGIGAFPPTIYRALYEREAIATRIVQLFPKECWQKTPTIYETEDPNDVTPFEEAWDNLGRGLLGERSWFQNEEGSPVWEYLRRADIYSGIGSFGILLLGVNDGKPLDQPVDGVMSYDPLGRVPVVTQGPVDSQGKPTRNVSHTQGVWYSVDDDQRVPSVPGPECNQRAVYEMDEKNPFKVINVRYENFVDVFLVNELPSRHKETGDQGTKIDHREPSGPVQFSSGEPYSQQGYLPGSGQQYLPTSGYKTTGGAGDPPMGGGPIGQGGGDKGDSAGPFIGQAPNYGSVGTDAQYVGIQLGPSEYPSAQAPEAEKPERKLTFLRVFSEDLVQIVQYEANVANPRFGRPVMYRVTLNDPRDMHAGIGLPMATVRVHWTRIIHLADNLGNSEIFGVPRLRPVLNRVLDLRKLYSGSAEMYWRGAFPGLSLETVPQLGGDVKVDLAGTRSQLEQYMNSLQRYLVLMGMSAKTLSPTVVDPGTQIQVQVEAICVQLGCPIRVFKGSERGELASAQDDDAWLDRLRERQYNYITPKLIVPFVDRLIMMGVLPAPTMGKFGTGRPKAEGTERAKDLKFKLKKEAPPPEEGTPPPEGHAKEPGGNPFATNHVVNATRGYRGDFQSPYVRNAEGKVVAFETPMGYSVEWPDLDAMNDTDKAGIALQETQALAAYVGGGVEAMLPPMEYLVHVMGWEDEQARSVLDAAQKANEDAELMTMPPQIQGRDAAAPEGTQESENDKKAAAQFDKTQQAKSEMFDKSTAAKSEMFDKATAAKKDLMGAKSGSKPPTKNVRQYDKLLSQIAGIVDDLNDGMGYGGAWYNPDTKTVWVSVGDWDDDPDRYTDALKGIKGVSKVRIEAEYSPTTDRHSGETWLVVNENPNHDEMGRFASGPGSAGASPDAKPGGLKGKLQAIGKALYDRSPKAVQKIVDVAMKVEHALEAKYKEGQELAKAVAKEQGLSDKSVEKVGKALAIADGVARWTGNIPVLHGTIETGLHGAIHALAHAGMEGIAHTMEAAGGPASFVMAKAAYYVPVASLAYIGVSAMADAAKELTGVSRPKGEGGKSVAPRNPFGLLKRAHERVKAMRVKRGEIVHHVRTEDLLDNSCADNPALALTKIFNMLDEGEQEDFMVLFCAALDQTGGDVDKSIHLAKNCLETFPVVTENSFCPTGEGGGVDPSCSPGEGGMPAKISEIRKLDEEGKIKDAGKVREELTKELKKHTPADLIGMAKGLGVVLRGKGKGDVIAKLVKHATAHTHARDLIAY